MLAGAASGGSSDNTIPIPASSISLKQDITERTALSTAQPSSMAEASELVRRYLQPYVLSETRPATSQEVDSYIADQLCVSPTAVRDELKKEGGGGHPPIRSPDQDLRAST